MNVTWTILPKHLSKGFSLFDLSVNQCSSLKNLNYCWQPSPMILHRWLFISSSRGRVFIDNTSSLFPPLSLFCLFSLCICSHTCLCFSLLVCSYLPFCVSLYIFTSSLSVMTCWWFISAVQWGKDGRTAAAITFKYGRRNMEGGGAVK